MIKYPASSPAAGTKRKKHCCWILWKMFFSLFVRRGDTKDQIKRKQLIVASMCMVFVSGLLPSISVFMRTESNEHESKEWSSTDQILSQLPTALAVSICVLELVLSLLPNGLSDRWLGVIIMGWLLTLCLVDIRTATGDAYMTAAGWPFVVVLLDAVLLFQLPLRLGIAVVVITLIYLVVLDVETKLRFGLLDLPGLPPYSERVFHCQCERPPCPTGAGDFFRVQALTSVAPTLLLDFLLTRSFAMQARSEKAYLELTVNSAIEVAAHLGTFNLDGAMEELVKHQHDMPPKLCHSFAKILQSLRGYHAYLPPSTFFEMEEESYTGEDNKSDDNELFRSVDLLGSNTTVTVPQSSVGISVDSSSQNTQQFRVQPISAEATGCRPPSPNQNQNGFRAEMVSLLAVNMRNSLDRVAQGLTSFLTEHTDVLQRILESSTAHRGVLDRVMGDHFYLSFNASLSCPAHSHAAVDTAFHIAGPDLTCAVVTGRGLCGSLGTTTYKCFSILGQLPLFLDGILRYARELDCEGSVIVSPVTRLSEDVRQNFTFRRVMRKVSVHKNGNEEDMAMFALVIPSDWGDGYDHDWESFNRAVELLLLGNRHAAQKSIETVGSGLRGFYEERKEALSRAVAMRL